MKYDAQLADPLADIRDVVESFRSFGLTPAGWEQTLSAAAAALDQLPPEVNLGAILPGLITNIRILLSQGLASTPKVLNKVADQVAAGLSQTKVPGIPLPEEDDWSFG